MTNLTSLLSQLEQERTRLASQVELLNRALSALDAAGNKRSGRTISAAGRARIAAAQRARWAKIKGRKVVSITRAIHDVTCRSETHRSRSESSVGEVAQREERIAVGAIADATERAEGSTAESRANNP